MMSKLFLTRPRFPVEIAMKPCCSPVVIWVFSLSVGLLTWPGGDRGLAQIIPDTTLGAENSLLTPGGTVVGGDPADLITGGAQRGANLFHSFQDFNVDEGGRVYFANPAATEVIFSRVTGGNPSNILGTLGVLGEADLFLVNPNGVLFGFDAILDVNGSFIATSADSVLFNNFAFSASAANAPAPLLTITAPIGLQYGAAPGEIVNQSFVDFLGLQLQPEQTLALLGGPVIMDGGFMTTTGGLIELGAVGPNSLIGLTPTNPGWAFNYAAVTEFEDIDLFYGAFLLDDNGGGIRLIGNNLNLLEGSQLVSLNFDSQAGDDIVLQASGEVLVTGAFPDDPTFNSGIFTIAGDAGRAGDIAITAQRLQVLAGGQIASNDSFSTASEGTGNITITAPEAVTVAGVTELLDNVSFITTQSSTGSGGTLTVTTGQLQLLEGGRLTTTTNGAGAGGQLVVEASDVVEIDGSVVLPGQGNFQSGLFSRADPDATAQAGNLSIETNRLTITNGGEISVGTLGDGDGGNLIINAAEAIEISGSSDNGLLNSRLVATTDGAGDGGTITLTTDQLRLLDGGQILGATFAAGDGGDVSIRAGTSIEVSGQQNQFLSSINSGSLVGSADAVATGDAGDLAIATPRLTLQNGGEIAVSTFGTGTAGQLRVQANQIDLAGQADFDGVTNGSLLRSRTLGSGSAGGITLTPFENGTTLNITLADDAEISAATTASGPGGTLTVAAPSSITITGQGSLLTETTGSGAAGAITFNTSNLTLQDGVTVSAQTSGGGPGGDVVINTANQVQLSNARVSAETTGASAAGTIAIISPQLNLSQGAIVTTATSASGRAGDIILSVYGQAPVVPRTLTINFQDQSVISAATSATGQGGSLAVSAPLGIFISGNGQLLTASTGTGNAGSLTFDTETLTVRDGVTVSAQTAGGGLGGSVTVAARNQFQLNNAVISAATAGASAAGAVTITSPEFRLQNGAIVTTSTTGSGAAGSITATGLSFFAESGGRLLTTTSSSGNAGSVTLTYRDVVNLTDAGTGLFANTEAGSSGAGGSIIVDPELIAVRNGAGIAVNSLGSGNAGLIRLSGNRLIVENDAFVSAETLTSSSQGIQLDNFRTIALTNGRISASTAQGSAGAIAANAQDSITAQGRGGFLVEATAGGTAGNLTLNTTQLALAEGASASVSSPTGIAGNLFVNAQTVRLNRGQITAETGLSASAAGGANIFVDGVEFLILENESAISATAFNFANGGNVDLNADFIIGTAPTGASGSDITANALFGNGGAVTITTTLLIGIEFRPQLTPDNDITVTSTFGLDGTFVQDDLGVDPTQGLGELATNLVDPSGLIDRSCDLAAQGQLSEFVVTGRGGLPPNVGDRVGGEFLLEDLGPSTLTATPMTPGSPAAGESRSQGTPAAPLTTTLSFLAAACPSSP